MDAPQLPGAEASASHPAGPAAPGQASAFRRALDKQAVAEAPGDTLVPSGAHDLTAPLDIHAVRAALAFGSPGETQIEQIPTPSLPTQSHAPLALESTPTVIRPPEPRPTASAAEPAPEPDGRRRRAPGRLPAAVWISAVLAALAGAALILVDQGRNSEPLAPSALPQASSHAATPAATQLATPFQPTPSPTASASHIPSPIESVSPSASASVTASASATSTDPVFTPLNQGSTGITVADVQRRLAGLGLMNVSPDGSSYRDSGWTLWEVQQSRGPSPDVGGYYGKATDFAVIAFKYHFIDNDQGPMPAGGCDAGTYAKLKRETAGGTTTK